jgi:hypothetical protein
LDGLEARRLIDLMKSAIRKIITVLAVLSFTVCAFVCASAYSTYQAAVERLAEFRELGVSKNPTARFDALRRKYGSKLRPLEGCTQRLCQYEIDLSNHRVAAFRIVPYTEMNIWFTSYEGSLQLAMLEYRTALKGRNSPVVHVQQGMCSDGCGVRFDVNPHGTTRQMWNGIVEFDTRASPEQRNAALALGLSCFARPGGCKDIIDLLPTMWTHNGSGAISSRFVGLSQELEESHGLSSPDDF